MNAFSILTQSKSKVKNKIPKKMRLPPLFKLNRMSTRMSKRPTTFSKDTNLILMA